jgi:phage baseplate assembly protein W
MSGPLPTLSRVQLPRPEIGWPLLPVPDVEGRLDWPDLATSVREMIEVILRTAPGEQLMRPAFGAGFDRLIHQPNTLATRARAQEAITEGIKLYEPRILLDQVAVDPGEDPRELLVTLGYRLRPSGASMRLSARIPVGAG